MNYHMMIDSRGNHHYRKGTKVMFIPFDALLCNDKDALEEILA